MIFSSLVLLVGIVLTMVAARTRISGHQQPIDTDCRFWSPTSPPSLHSLLSMTSSSPSVFYWWDTSRAQCLPCSRCRGSLVTLHPCTILSDTKCGAREELEQMLGLTVESGESDYWEGAGGEVREFSDDGQNIEGGQREEQEEVWGRQRLREGAGGEVEGARLLVREGLVERGGKLVQAGGMGPESQFGRPSFYTPQEQEEAKKERGARPILDIMRQFLRKNVTEKPWRSGKRVGRGRIRGSRRTTTTTTTTTTTATTPETTTKEVWAWQPAKFNNAIERDFNIEREDELYGDDNYDSEPTKYEIENENDYGIEHDVVEELVSTTISPGDAAIRELFHMIESGRDDLETAVEQVPEHITLLQQLLIGASSILVLLILALVILIVKRRGAQADVERKLSGQPSSRSGKQPPQHLPSSTSLQAVPSAVARSLRNIRREQHSSGPLSSESVRDANKTQEMDNFRSTPLPRAIAVDVRGVTRLA